MITLHNNTHHHHLHPGTPSPPHAPWDQSRHRQSAHRPTIGCQAGPKDGSQGGTGGEAAECL